MARTKCHGDKMSADKMARTKCHGQKGTDKMARTKCHGDKMSADKMSRTKCPEDKTVWWKNRWKNVNNFFSLHLVFL